MKIIDLELTNVRTFKSAKFRVPEGVSLLIGENGSGKSTLLGTAAAWAIWGQVPGRSQDHLVRHGEREMTVRVNLTAHSHHYLIERRFRLKKSGKGGDTKLSLYRKTESPELADLTEPINRETQQSIIDLFGRYEVWAATAYVGQREGAGYFLEAKPADRRTILREIIDADADWDKWEAAAKDEVRQVSVQIERLSGAIPVLEETATLSEHREMNVAHWKKELKELKRPIGDLEGRIVQARETSGDLNDDITKLTQQLRVWDFQQSAKELAQQNADQAERRLLRHDERIAANMKTAEKLPEAEKKNNAHLEKMRRREAEAAEIRSLNNVEIRKYHDAQEIQRTSTQERCDKCGQLIEPDPVKAPELLKEPTLMIVNLELEGRVRTAMTAKEAVEIAEEERIELADQMDETAEILTEIQKTDPPEGKDRQAIVNEIRDDRSILKDCEDSISENVQTLAEVQRRETEATANLARAEESLAAATDAKDRLRQTQKEITAGKVSLGDWKHVAELTGTSGVRQLVIDQSIGAMEAASNRWLNIIAPNFSIYFSTQTETDRETFEEGVITPSGNLEPWSELSGAQSVAVALAVRLGLAEVGGAAHGVHYQTLYLDEADAWLSGEYQQQFMEYINKVAETGIDIVCITHIEGIKEMVDQQTFVTSTGNGTSEVWQS